MNYQVGEGQERESQEVEGVRQQQQDTAYLTSGLDFLKLSLCSRFRRCSESARSTFYPRGRTKKKKKEKNRQRKKRQKKEQTDSGVRETKRKKRKNNCQAMISNDAVRDTAVVRRTDNAAAVSYYSMHNR